MAFRVAWVSVTSAALGGLLAAVVAIVAVDRLIAEHADQRLRAAVITLAGELDEDGSEGEANLAGTLDDENDEIVESGIRLAVFAQGQPIAGDAWITPPPPGACVSHGDVRRRVRACARAYGPWVLVAAQASDVSRLHLLYALSALGAVALGAGTGLVLGLGLSRWAVGPLERLAGALRTSRPDADPVALGPPSDCEEVEALRTALGELMQRTRALLDQARRFAADAAHELRTPLTALRAELELLAEEATEGERAALERACERVARLSALVERLLVLAIPPDHLERGFETVALADVVTQEVAERSPRERERVRLDLGSDGLVRGDARLLGSLVANALGNALKFAPEGPVTVRVADTPGGRVLLEIEDEGPGIPEALRARVFEPFYRVRPLGVGGHGLGLALIAHIARAHGGHAEIRDVPRGACIAVSLPAWTPGPDRVSPALDADARA
ncbi:MAG TPA: HAMP domain-containing sensor histidine kinase [Polyangiaceae bacterium]|nr:HAMP domain-containing sensor histidine kinase [Polyangiaceae bacterium]